MKIIGIIAIIIVLVLAVLLALLSHYGLFATVNVTEKYVGPYLLVYTKHIGDYNDVAPVMDRLNYDLKDNHSIDSKKGFGIYYDSPQEVAKENLRSVVGCIVEGKSVAELMDVSKKYGVNEYPLSKSLVAEFPHKGYLSIMFGIFKVYPKLNEYIQEHKYDEKPIMELYDQPNERIEYIISVRLPEEVFESFLE